MEETLNDKEDPEEMMMEDRETQKKLVHPYRKYQLWILVLVIIGIILGIISFNLNFILVHLVLQNVKVLKLNLQ